jgi:hypothetical protein
MGTVAPAAQVRPAHFERDEASPIDGDSDLRDRPPTPAVGQGRARGPATRSGGQHPQRYAPITPPAPGCDPYLRGRLSHFAHNPRPRRPCVRKSFSKIAGASISTAWEPSSAGRNGAVAQTDGSPDPGRPPRPPGSISVTRFVRADPKRTRRRPNVHAKPRELAWLGGKAALAVSRGRAKWPLT